MNIEINAPKVDVQLKRSKVDVDTGTPVAKEYVERPAYSGPYNVTPGAAQTLATEGKRMTDDVTVQAVPGDYVGPSVPRQSQLSKDGPEVTAPAGYYANAVSETVQSGSVTTPDTEITANPSLSVNAAGKVTASVSASDTVQPSVSPGWVNGAESGDIEVSGSAEMQLSTQAGKTVTPTTSEQTAVETGRFTTGPIKVAPIPPDYVGSGIPRRSSSDLSSSGPTITAPAGYYEQAASKSVPSGTEGTPIATKSAVSNHAVTVTPSVTNTEGYISGGTKTGTGVQVTAAELESGTKTITQAGVADVTNYATATVPSARAMAGMIDDFVTESNQRKWRAKMTVFVDPEEGGQAGWIAEGTSGENALTFNAVPANTTITPSTSAQTIGGARHMMEGPVTVAAMPSGTAGTPTAIKGTVSDHSVTITPSVTNTTGYITGSNKTGTAVTVTAAELESGTKSITQNGSGIDVTGFAAVDVAVPSGGVDFDTKTVTASNYPTSLQFTGMKGRPKAFVLRLNASVSSSGSTTYYYIVDISAFGDTTHGNCFRVGSTRQVTNLTSGYSWSYSGTTLTITSSAASRSSSPGAFYNGSYELMYCY